MAHPKLINPETTATTEAVEKTEQDASGSVRSLEAARNSLSNFPYETALFHQCWWQSLASRFDIPVKMGDLLIRRKKLLKGLVTFREARVSGWNNAWSQDLTAARVDALEELAHTSGWDYFRLVWNESRLDKQALEKLNEKGLLWLQKPAPTEYWIDLSDGYEGYLAALSTSTRKSIRKRAQSCSNLKPELTYCRTDEEIDAFFAEFFPLHLKYWDAKTGESYFHVPEERQFISQWAKALNQNGQLLMDRLIMDGKTVNMSMNVRAGDAVYGLLTINTGELLKTVPGLVGLAMRTEDMAKQDVKSFQLGSGNYSYKQQYTNRQNACHEVIVCNPRSLKGKLYYQWAKRQGQSNQSQPTGD